MKTSNNDPNKSDWLNNKQWATNNISSLSLFLQIQKRKVAILFSVVFLIAALPSISQAFMGINSNLWVVASFLFIPFSYAEYDFIKNKLDYKRFGEAFCVLDPFPGIIGGQVGGKILVSGQFPKDAKYTVQLKYNHKIKWTTTQTSLAKADKKDICIGFLFDVPSKISNKKYRREFYDAIADENYHHWQVSVIAEWENNRVIRAFSIPVYKL